MLTIMSMQLQKDYFFEVRSKRGYCGTVTLACLYLFIYQPVTIIVDYGWIE